MANIYGASKHPIEIKKINLRVWTLRAEVESLIKERFEHSTEGEEISIEDLINEYSTGQNQNHTGLTLLSGGKDKKIEDEDDLEAQMAAAMNAPADEEAAEQGPEQNAENETAASDNKESALAANASTEKSSEENKVDPLLIIQKKADLSDEDSSSAICILTDINMEGINFFSKSPFIYGQSIILEFLIPNHFSICAEVVRCVNYNSSSRIISQTRPPYRLMAKFTFLRRGERTLLRNLVNSIQLSSVSSAKAQNTQKEAPKDELDDLDDLGI